VTAFAALTNSLKISMDGGLIALASLFLSLRKLMKMKVTIPDHASCAMRLWSSSRTKVVYCCMSSCLVDVGHVQRIRTSRSVGNDEVP
jgi:hypothetical protein